MARHAARMHNTYRTDLSWGRKAKLPILYMLHPLLKERDDMLVINPVIDFLAIPARLDHVHLPQAAHVMGDSRLTDPDDFRQRADVHFTG
jgi:hypothetical protein